MARCVTESASAWSGAPGTAAEGAAVQADAAV